MVTQKYPQLPSKAIVDGERYDYNADTINCIGLKCITAYNELTSFAILHSIDNVRKGSCLYTV